MKNKDKIKKFFTNEALGKPVTFYCPIDLHEKILKLEKKLGKNNRSKSKIIQYCLHRSLRQLEMRIDAFLSGKSDQSTVFDEDPTEPSFIR